MAKLRGVVVEVVEFSIVVEVVELDEDVGVPLKAAQ